MTIQKTRAEILAIAQNLNIQTGFIRVYSYVDDMDSRLDNYKQYSMYDADLPAMVEGVCISFYDRFGRVIERLESTVETVTVTPAAAEELPVKQFRALTGASLVVSVNIIRDLVRLTEYASVDELVHEAVELYSDLDYPATLAEYETALADELFRSVQESTDETVKTQLDALYADNEFCQHEEEIAALESQLKSMNAASYRTLDGNIVHCSINELAERLDKPVEACPDYWDFSEIPPAQKPATKNRVVCTIASKLAKRGVKNPMRAAWSLYNATCKMLHAINTGNIRLAIHIARQIKTKIYGLDNTSIITDFFGYKTAEFIINLAR